MNTIRLLNPKMKKLKLKMKKLKMKMIKNHSIVNEGESFLYKDGRWVDETTIFSNYTTYYGYNPVDSTVLSVENGNVMDNFPIKGYKRVGIEIPTPIDEEEPTPSEADIDDVPKPIENEAEPTELDAEDVDENNTPVNVVDADEEKLDDNSDSDSDFEDEE
eukprot:jgi/Orpsp1_1/1187954/evm.model.d7180000061424.1